MTEWEASVILLAKYWLIDIFVYPCEPPIPAGLVSLYFPLERIIFSSYHVIKYSVKAPDKRYVASLVDGIFFSLIADIGKKTPPVLWKFCWSLGLYWWHDRWLNCVGCLWNSQFAVSQLLSLSSPPTRQSSRPNGFLWSYRRPFSFLPLQYSPQSCWSEKVIVPDFSPSQTSYLATFSSHTHSWVVKRRNIGGSSCAIAVILELGLRPCYLFWEIQAGANMSVHHLEVYGTGLIGYDTMFCFVNSPAPAEAKHLEPSNLTRLKQAIWRPGFREGKEPRRVLDTLLQDPTARELYV